MYLFVFQSIRNHYLRSVLSHIKTILIRSITYSYTVYLSLNCHDTQPTVRSYSQRNVPKYKRSKVTGAYGVAVLYFLLLY